MEICETNIGIKIDRFLWWALDPQRVVTKQKASEHARTRFATIKLKISFCFSETNPSNKYHQFFFSPFWQQVELNYRKNAFIILINDARGNCRVFGEAFSPSMYYLARVREVINNPCRPLATPRQNWQVCVKKVGGDELAEKKVIRLMTGFVRVAWWKLTAQTLMASNSWGFGQYWMANYGFFSDFFKKEIPNNNSHKIFFLQIWWSIA